MNTPDYIPGGGEIFKGFFSDGRASTEFDNVGCNHL